MLFPSAAERRDAASDLAVCRALMRLGSRSFHAASLLLPSRVRDPATALYAFCRLADDAVDGKDGVGPSDPAAALDGLRARLDVVYSGERPDHPVDRAFAATVRATHLPRALPEALFEGFAWDAEGRTYRSPEGVEAYAVRVAGTVGLMMAVVMGRRDPHVLARACDLGVAMQLTNIARDVGEDARAGRLYLPLDWMAEEGIDPQAFLRDPRPSPELARVIERLLGEARRLYRRARSGIAALPSDCAPAIHAARLVYAEIGRGVAAAGHDSVTGRAVVPGRRKAALIGRAYLAALVRPALGTEPPVAAAAPLVRAVADAAVPPARETLDAKVGWLVDLYTRLEQAERPRAEA